MSIITQITFLALTIQIYCGVVDVHFHSENIKSLTSSNFKSELANGLHIVEFYAPSCIHCQKFAPTYIELSKKHSTLHKTINFAQVNCKEHSNLCEDLRINAYPSLHLYLDGWKVEEINQERTFDKLSSYLTSTSLKYKNFEEPVIELHSMDTVNRGIFFVKYYTPYCQKCIVLRQKYEDAGEKLRPLRSSHKLYLADVNCMVEKSICVDPQSMTYPAFKLFSDGQLIEEYTGGLEQKDIVEYLIGKVEEISKKSVDRRLFGQSPLLEKENVPVVKHRKKPRGKQDYSSLLVNPGVVISLTPETFVKQISRGPWLIAFCTSPSEECQKLVPVWTESANYLAASVNVAIVDCTRNGYCETAQKIIEFPTIKFFLDGYAISEHHGSRSVPVVTRFALESFSKEVYDKRPNPLFLILPIIAFAVYIVVFKIGSAGGGHGPLKIK